MTVGPIVLVTDGETEAPIGPCAGRWLDQDWRPHLHRGAQ